MHNNMMKINHINSFSFKIDVFMNMHNHKEIVETHKKHKFPKKAQLKKNSLPQARIGVKIKK